MASVPGAQLAVLWAALATLYIVSRLLGSLARRLGQPPILGALVAGVLLSTDVFGRAWPGASHWLFPAQVGESRLLSGVAQLGLVLLSFVLGLGTDVALLRRLGHAIAAVGSWSFALPLAGGAVLGALLSHRFIGSSGSRAALVVLLAGALAVSSLPVIAWIVRELGISGSPVGKLAVGIATVHDGLGFVVLAIAVALTEGNGTARLVEASIGLVVLVGFTAFVGPPLYAALARRLEPDADVATGGLGVVVGTLLVLAALAQLVHLDGALGAFVAGVAIGRSPYGTCRGVAALDTLATSVFAPIYFADATLQIRLALFAHLTVAATLIAFILVGVLCKLVGSSVGARLSRIKPRESLAVGVALNGRGTMQVIIASVGLRHGAVSSDGFTVVVAGSIITTLLMAPALRLASKPVARAA